VRLEGKRVDGFEIVVEEIPLRFNENRDAIEGHIARIDHSVVICTGQSGRASISLERVVINVADAKPRTLVALAPWMSSSMV
jgi:pyrrolidone-carboxylate peptidase